MKINAKFWLQLAYCTARLLSAVHRPLRAPRKPDAEESPNSSPRHACAGLPRPCPGAARPSLPSPRRPIRALIFTPHHTLPGGAGGGHHGRSGNDSDSSLARVMMVKLRVWREEEETWQLRWNPLAAEWCESEVAGRLEGTDRRGAAAGVGRPVDLN